MVDLRQRANDPEALDIGVPEDEARRSLDDLRFVNRWFGNRRPFLRAVLPHLSAPRSRLLDVGCGSGDMPLLVKQQRGDALLAVGVDLKLVHLRAVPGGLERVVGDVRALPFAPRSFDVVTASLFLHHFDSTEAPQVLRGLFDLARGALVVNDLHRSIVPYAFGKAVFPLVFKSRVSREDGLISIRRAFTPEELRAAFVAAGLPQVRVHTTFPYRILAVAARGDNA